MRKYINFALQTSKDLYTYFRIRSKITFPKILSIEETLDLVNKEKISFARYGDAEFNHIAKIGIGYQEGTAELSERLKEVLQSDQNHCLVCIPGSLYKLSGMVWQSQLMWVHLIAKFYKNYYQLLDANKVYPNSLMTRPYMDLSDKSRSAGIFTKLKQIWQDRDLLIVEGEHTKLGVGNDLFENANSIKRIITVSKNAFAKYDLILSETQKMDKNLLVLIALGGTATVLAYDLSKEGFQACDVGHMDVEYEWFLLKTEKKVALKGKFVNELSTDNPTTTLEDAAYESQIIKKLL